MAIGRRVQVDFTSYVAERTSGFVGREWVLEDVRAWLESPSGPRFLLITGAPGSGKTAVAARLVELSERQAEPDTPAGDASPLPRGFLGAWHFCSASDDRWRDPRTFAESLGTQLARRNSAFAQLLAERASGSGPIVQGTATAGTNYGLVAGTYIERLVLQAETAEEAFRDAVREPLESLLRAQPDTRIVLLIDALDESAGLGEGRITGIAGLLARTSELPAGVRIIATTRPDDRIARAFARQVPPPAVIALSDQEGIRRSAGDIAKRVREWLHERVDVRSRLRQEVTADQLAELIAKRARGNFLYVRLLLAMLGATKGRIGAKQLDEIPDGLDAAYIDYLERVSSGRPNVGRVLAALAVAGEPLTNDQVASFSRLRPEPTNAALVAIHQLLAPELRDGRSALYHRSFAELLLDRARAHEFWRDPVEAHARVANAYKPRGATWEKVDWSAIDDYGLRHLPMHAAGSVAGDGESRAAAVAAVITPKFIQASTERFGGRSTTLTALGDLLDLAIQEGDAALAIRAAWTHAAVRDRTALETWPDLIHVYVVAGRTREVEARLTALSRDHEGSYGDGTRVRAALARAFAAQGNVDDAMRIVNEVEASARPGVRATTLASLAAIEPARSAAMALAMRDAGELQHVDARVLAELCGALAAANAYVEDALSLATGSDLSIVAVGRAVAPRARDRALAIAALTQTYEDPYTRELRHGGDEIRAAVAEEVAKANLDGVDEILAAMTTRPGWERALVRVAAVGASRDPAGFFDLLHRRIEARPRRSQWGFELNPLKGTSPKRVSDGLALAHVLASPQADASLRRTVRAWYDVSREDILASPTDGMLFDAIDALALVADATARDLLLDYAGAVGDRLAEHGAVEESEDQAALDRVVHAIAHADVNTAVALVDRVEAANSSRSFLRANALAGVVSVIARRDVAAAYRFLHEHTQTSAHDALLSTSRTLARTSIATAIAFAESTPEKFAVSRIAALGAIGSALGPGDAQAARDLLARLPPYHRSETFTEPRARIETVIAAELEARDLLGRASSARAKSLTAQFAGERASRSFAHTVVRAVARLAPARLEELAGEIPGESSAALAMLLAARAFPSADARHARAKKALEAVRAGHDTSNIIAHAALLVGSSDPRVSLAAAGVADHQRSRFESWPVLRRCLELLLAAKMDPAAIAGELLILTVAGCGVASLDAIVSEGRKIHHRVATELLDLADDDSAMETLRAFETLGIADDVERWLSARRIPEAVLVNWGASSPRDQITLSSFAARAARECPEVATWQVGRSLDGDAYLMAIKPVVVEAIKGTMLRDFDAGLALAADFRRRPLGSIETAVSDGLRESAIELLTTNWPRAIRAIAAIPEETARSVSIRQLAWVAANDPAASATCADEAFWAELADLASRIVDHTSRESMYATVFDALDWAPPPVAVTYRLLHDIGLADRDTSLAHLHRMVTLLCVNDESLPERLLDEPQRVCELASA